MCVCVGVWVSTVSQSSKGEEKEEKRRRRVIGCVVIVKVGFPLVPVTSLSNRCTFCSDEIIAVESRVCVCVCVTVGVGFPPLEVTNSNQSKCMN